MKVSSIKLKKGRVQHLTGALVSVIKVAMKVAAKCPGPAGLVVRILQRVLALSSVFESGTASKKALHHRQESNSVTNSQRQLIEQLSNDLTFQETEIPKRAEASSAMAQQVIGTADGTDQESEQFDNSSGLFKRTGRGSTPTGEEAQSGDKSKNKGD